MQWDGIYMLTLGVMICASALAGNLGVLGIARAADNVVFGGHNESVNNVSKMRAVYKILMLPAPNIAEELPILAVGAFCKAKP